MMLSLTRERCQFPLWPHIGLSVGVSLLICLWTCTGISEWTSMCQTTPFFLYQCVSLVVFWFFFFPVLSFVVLHRPADFQTSTARRRNQGRGAASRSESKATAWARAGEEEAGCAGGTAPPLWSQVPYNVKMHSYCFLAIRFLSISCVTKI